MSCYQPIDVIVKGKAWNTSREVTVGCGICIGCRTEQARQWSVRIMHERQMHDSAWFITLTYDEESLPDNGSLCAEDLQKFFKAVRRDYPAGTVRYFACGEYGDESQRPHYHAVLYGVDFLDRYFLRCDNGYNVWRSAHLEHYWDNGFSEFGTVTPKSASYVAGYVKKKVAKRVNPDAYLRVDVDTGELFDVEPEFNRMSLRPAIGRSWIERYWQDVYPRDYVVVDGKEFKPPRYYDKWMDMYHPDIMLDVREKRINEAVEKTAYQLMAGEKIHKARDALFSSRGKV